MKKFLVGLLLLAVVGLVFGGMAIAKDKYVVASDIPWDPFEMVTADGQYFGFDLDVMRAIAVVEGFDIQIQNIAFDSIIPAVKAGKADIGASGFSITEERAKAVTFSNPYYLSNQAVVIRKDSGLNIVTALAGKGPTKAIGAQNGTTGFDWIKDNLIDNGFPVKQKGYETYPMAILDLVNGRVDAVIQDQPASRASLAAYPTKLTIAGIINTYEYFGFLVAKDDPKGILPKLNEGMEKLGLTARKNPTGKYDLTVVPGSVWDNLMKAYFGPSSDKIEAAWLKTKDLLLNAQTLADVEKFAAAFAEEANK
ncbi:basic amino acid ABC transporter substrate-binding protein [Candidatus Acetothermia bacterium]|nr:MAG: basic amino acid ABC transporter substrate-binding protein [Candidatus Acetothermia bacterium]